MNARQRRQQRRSELRSVLAGGQVFAARAPGWKKTTADEVLANCRRLLGYTPMAEELARAELRELCMPNAPTVVRLPPTALLEPV